MNIKFFACMAVFSFASLTQCLVDDNIANAIRASDPEALSKLLMPGVFVRTQDRKIYNTLAQQKTKEAHASLESSGFSDIYHAFAGVFKAVGVYYAGYTSFTGFNKTSFTTLTDTAGDAVNAAIGLKGTEFQDAALAARVPLWDNAQSFFGGALALYLLNSCKNDIVAMLYKTDRQEKYLRALAVESLMARIPVSE